MGICEDVRSVLDEPPFVTHYEHPAAALAPLPDLPVLKRCPHCDGRARLILNGSEPEMEAGYFVECSWAACRSRTPVWHGSHAPLDAITAWNRRVCEALTISLDTNVVTSYIQQTAAPTILAMRALAYAASSYVSTTGDDSAPCAELIELRAALDRLSMIPAQDDVQSPGAAIGNLLNPKFSMKA